MQSSEYAQDRANDSHSRQRSARCALCLTRCRWYSRTAAAAAAGRASHPPEPPAADDLLGLNPSCTAPAACCLLSLSIDLSPWPILHAVWSSSLFGASPATCLGLASAAIAAVEVSPHASYSPAAGSGGAARGTVEPGRSDPPSRGSSESRLECISLTVSGSRWPTSARPRTE